jgi:hypothetical protein
MLPGHVLGEFVPRLKFATTCCHNFLPHLNKFDILGRSIVDGTFDGFVGVGEAIEEKGLNLLLNIGSRDGRNGRKKGNERHLGNHFERKERKGRKEKFGGFLCSDRRPTRDGETGIPSIFSEGGMRRLNNYQKIFFAFLFIQEGAL